MTLRGINRIVVAVNNLEKSKKFYSEALGATFHEANWTGEPFGIEVAISWDAGIELCAPLPGREDDSVVSLFLAENGEGVMTTIFGVSDADAAKKKAESAGVAPFHSLDYSQEEMDSHLDGMFKKYEEHFLKSISTNCLRPLRDLKRAAARRKPKARAGCPWRGLRLADACFRSRPSGLTDEPRLRVIISRRATSMPSK